MWAKRLVIEEHGQVHQAQCLETQTSSNLHVVTRGRDKMLSTEAPVLDLLPEALQAHSSIKKRLQDKVALALPSLPRCKGMGSSPNSQ